MKMPLRFLGRTAVAFFALSVMFVVACSTEKPDTTTATNGEPAADSDAASPGDNTATSASEASTDNASEESSAAPSPQADPESMRALGLRMLDALKNDDADAFQACWLRGDDFEEVIANPPPGAPEVSANELAEMREYMGRRDEIVRLTFPMLRRALAESSGDLETLQLDSISGKVRVRHGIQGVNGFDIVFATKDGRKINYRVDDGVLANGRWYFTDRPGNTLNVDPEGRFESVPIAKYATEDELRQLDTVLNR